VVAEYEATLVVGYDTLCEFIDEAEGGRLNFLRPRRYRIEITDIAFALEGRARKSVNQQPALAFSAKSSKLPVMGLLPTKTDPAGALRAGFLFFGCNPTSRCVTANAISKLGAYSTRHANFIQH